MLAVTVTLRIRFDQRSAFLPLMRTQAETSRAQEPGCHAFEIWTSAEDPGLVFLYEVYTDRSAFDVHLASVHFRTFDAATAPMILEKSVAFWEPAEGAA